MRPDRAPGWGRGAGSASMWFRARCCDRRRRSERSSRGLLGLEGQFGQGAAEQRLELWPGIDRGDDRGQTGAGLRRADRADGDSQHRKQRLSVLRVGPDGVADLAQRGELGTSAAMNGEEYAGPERRKSGDADAWELGAPLQLENEAQADIVVRSFEQARPEGGVVPAGGGFGQPDPGASTDADEQAVEEAGDEIDIVLLRRAENRQGEGGEIVADSLTFCRSHAR